MFLLSKFAFFPLWHSPKNLEDFLVKLGQAKQKTHVINLQFYAHNLSSRLLVKIDIILKPDQNQIAKYKNLFTKKIVPVLVTFCDYSL